MKTKAIKLSALVLSLAITGGMLLSCASDNKDETTEAEEDFTSSTEAPVSPFGGIEWETSGKALISADGVLSCEDKSEGGVFFADALEPKFTMAFEAKVSSGTTGSIGIKLTEDGLSGHLIRFNINTKTVALVSLVNGEESSVASKACRIEKDKWFKVYAECTGTALRIYVYDNPGEENPYPKIDALVGYSRFRGLSFKCGKNSVNYRGLEINNSPDFADAPGTRYINPVTEGADPFILFHDGTFYLYSTNSPSNGYKVSTSKDMVNWADKGFCLVNADVFENPTSSAGFWAPEVLYRDGRFYMIYTCDSHLGLAVADSPLGPFKNTYTSNLSRYREIDGHILVDDDSKSYIYFVRYKDNGVAYGIYGAEFDFENPSSYAGKAKLLLHPENEGSWEYKEGYVSEGPFIIKHNGLYYLTYTANGYTSQYYAVGYATSASPLGTYVKYAGNPILSMSPVNDVYGPGHHSFSYSADGKELFIVYHRHNSKTSVHARKICIDRCKFVVNPDGGPDILSVYGPTSSPQPKPSGTY